MKVQVDEMWVTPRSLVLKVSVWGSAGEWRQKRYASVPFDMIPEEVIIGLTESLMDLTPEEDHHQTALF